MKLTILTSSIVLLLLLSGCRSKPVYVPVEASRYEYLDKIRRDSVYVHDSVFMQIKGDTLWLEKYKTVYKEKLIRDSVFITDSIQVPYPIVEIKEVNKLNSFQNVQIWCGRIALLLILIVLGIKMRKFI